MSDQRPVRLHDLYPSPNSKKVRLALGWKKIEHECIAVDPGDRGAIVALSGQPLTPVLEHGETVVFDSNAIVRYLEANVQREPRLFSAEYDAMKAIEGWEAFVQRRLGPFVGALFGQFFAAERDASAIEEARRGFNLAAAELEGGLGPDGWLVGSSPTAGDLACAAAIGLSLLTERHADMHPMMAFFRENLSLDPERDALRRWYAEIDRHDGVGARPRGPA